MKAFSVLSFFFLLSLFSLSARIEVDSLRSVAANVELSASSRMNAMDLLASHYIHTQPDSTRFFAEQHLSLAKSTEDKSAEGRALFGVPIISGVVSIKQP